MYDSEVVSNLSYSIVLVFFTTDLVTSVADESTSGQKIMEQQNKLLSFY